MIRTRSNESQISEFCRQSSYSDSRIARFESTFTDGGKAPGQSVERAYSQPGTYSEILKITDDRAHTDYDFETVNVLDPHHPEQTPPSIQAANWLTTLHVSEYHSGINAYAPARGAPQQR